MKKVILIGAGISTLIFGGAAMASPPPASQPTLSVVCRNLLSGEISGTAIGNFVRFDGKKLQVLKLTSAGGDIETIATLDGSCTIEPTITFTLTNGCPNFSGNYSSEKSSVWASYTTYEVMQSGCNLIKMTKVIHELGRVNPPIVTELTVDGVRHDGNGSGIYWKNSWQGDRLLQEPWSAATGGELLGDRGYWLLRKNSKGQTILVNQIVDDSGNINLEETFEKQ